MRNIVKYSFLIVAPAIFALAYAQNFILALFIAVALGMAINLNHSSLVGLGQAYLPNSVGLASGVTFGLFVSIGGIAMLLVGMFADTHGVQSMLYLLSALCFVSMIFCFS